VGISWVDQPDGFRYFIGVPVEPGAPAPAGMRQVSIPSLEFVACDHRGGEVAASIRKLFLWMSDHGLQHDQSCLTYLEEYPTVADPSGPRCMKVLVPVLRGSGSEEDDDF
jgi:predicted transcriptional regulator YdeE